MILLPARPPMSPYRFASWARGTFVALMIVLSRNPTFRQPVGCEELFPEPPGRPGAALQDAGTVDAGADAQPDAGAALQPAADPGGCGAWPRRGWRAGSASARRRTARG